MAFDQQTLDQYKEKLLIMASHAEGVVSRAVRAHLDRDGDLAKQTLETDETIDQFEIQIDRIALGLLSQAPGEFELRQITCGMKIARELERVGDEATTIARRAVELMTGWIVAILLFSGLIGLQLGWRRRYRSLALGQGASFHLTFPTPQTPETAESQTSG